MKKSEVNEAFEILLEEIELVFDMTSKEGEAGFKSQDFHIPSNSKQRRWENTAQWARNTMVNEGLLSADSPRGIWEITKKGRDFYNQNK